MVLERAAVIYEWRSTTLCASSGGGSMEPCSAAGEEMVSPSISLSRDLRESTATAQGIDFLLQARHGGKRGFIMSVFSQSFCGVEGRPLPPCSSVMVVSGRCPMDFFNLQTDIPLGLKTERKRTKTCFITFLSACLVEIGNEPKIPETKTKAEIVGDEYGADTERIRYENGHVLKPNNILIP
jgi:hypothetical protein